MPTNLYGPRDNFNLTTSHVLPALLRKAHEAKENRTKQLVIWGSGKPLREFLHVDDLASACIFIMGKPTQHAVINVGSGYEISIRALAELICAVVDVDCEIILDDSKPDGTTRKLLDTARLSELGWKAKISLKEGISQVYSWYKTSLQPG